MELIYNKETGTWGEAPEYSTTVYFETEEDREKFNDALKNWYKYKWHDLEKNPDDLPEEDKEVLVTFRYYFSYEREIAVLWHTEAGWVCSLGLLNGKAIAWREIEPFEGDE